jgi:hypothetical protein
MTDPKTAPMTLADQAERLRDQQASTLLEAEQALLTSGYSTIHAYDSRTGRIIVRVVNPRGQESTYRVPATENGLRNAIAQVVTAHQPGPVIAPPAERSGR